MSVIVANVMRGNVVESIHHGYVVVSNGNGTILASAGDIQNCYTFIRSAAKPIQSLNVLLSGAQDQFNFTVQELAIMCSSHYGQFDHRQTIYSIMEKIGCAMSDLQCGTPLSIYAPYMQEQLRENMILDESSSDCSGKHTGFLAVCRAKGYPIENYNLPEHPLQKDVLHILSQMSDVSESEIEIAVDGCGVPVHAIPLAAAAKAYARFSTPDHLSQPYKEACQTLYNAMVTHPDMVAGNGGFCTELMRTTKGRLCGKLGAESVYCIGVQGKDMGIAVKIADGAFRALYPTVLSTLTQLHLITDEELAELKHFAQPDVINDLGNCVGAILPCFQLKHNSVGE